jgi:hypothetical protein
LVPAKSRPGLEPLSETNGSLEGATARWADLAWVNEILCGVPVEVTVGSKDTGEGMKALAEFAALPSPTHPHLLVPVDSREAAQRALQNYMDARRTVRAAAAVLALGVRAGILPALRQHVRVSAAPGHQPGPGLASYLRDVLGRDDLRIAVRMGGQRPNRKPVLQVLTPSGGILAYVKVGWNDLTRSLVRNEIEVLRALTESGKEPRTFAFPAVLHSGRWDDLEVLVMAPVAQAPWRRGVGSEDELAAIAREVAALTPESRHELGTSDYWKTTRSRLDALSSSVRPSRLNVVHDLVARLEDRYGGTELHFGECHGDWTRWNMAGQATKVMIFDWERSGRRVPVGMDAAHFDFDLAVKWRRKAPLYAVRSLLTGGGTVLPHFTSSAVPARVLISLDLLEMLLRYEEARSAGLDIPDTLYFGAFRSAVLSPTQRLTSTRARRSG